MNLFLIDGIGPFFRDYPRHRINWSKIPFDNLERNGAFDAHRFAAAESDFARFADRAAAMGFNGITLDDLAHLSDHPAYPPPLRAKLECYREAYSRLFEAAAARGLTVYITSDVSFTLRAARRPWLGTRRDPAPFFSDACEALFRNFPTLGGIIFRIGECDARDVRGDFASHLAIRTPSQAREFIRRLLPIFEHRAKLLIFRTWTVGAYPIGDLIWNRNTFDRVFGDFDSPNLVLSMKYGETDFFRYLPLNKLFFRGRLRKIVELQTRREYEGFGEFPSFTGWDYEQYLQALSGTPGMAGVWVWCQTGGWSVFRRRTFLEPAGIWNELNTATTLRMARDGVSADDAVRDWAGRHLGPGAAERLLILLRLSDETVKEGLYIDEFARRKLFFRRLRIPPLLSVLWDQIVVNHSMRKLMRCFVRDPEGKLAQSESALEKIRSMRTLASELGMPASDFDFQYDTFLLLAATREYYLSAFTPELARRLQQLKDEYETRHPRCYALRLDFTRFRLPRSQLRLLFALLLRSQRGYRWLDRLLLIRLMALFSPLLTLRRRRPCGGRLTDQAMGIRTVLK